MPRFVVYGLYADPPQIVMDIVDAEDDEAAALKVKEVRGPEYVEDSTVDIEDAIAGLVELKQQDAAKTEGDLEDLRVRFAAPKIDRPKLRLV